MIATSDLQARNLTDQLLRQLDDQTALQRSIHAAHAEDRLSLMRALITSGDDRHVGWALRMNACATSATLHWTAASRQVRPAVLRCRSRLCPHCAKIRSARIAEQVYQIARTYAHARYITLTVAHQDTPLRDQFRKLRADFSRLRRTGLWERAVRTGVYTLEVTQNEDTKQWHPHVNILYDGEYIPQKLLKFHWQRITGASKIVWISDAHDIQGAAYEMCKYIGKPQHVAHLSDESIRAYADAVHGTRMVQQFGDRVPDDVADEDVDEPLPPDTWAITMARLMYLAAGGNPHALEAALLAAQRWPMFAQYTYTSLPDHAPAGWKPTLPFNYGRHSRAFPVRPRAPHHTPAEDRALEERLSDLISRIHDTEHPPPSMDLDAVNARIAAATTAQGWSVAAPRPAPNSHEHTT